MRAGGAARGASTVARHLVPGRAVTQPVDGAAKAANAVGQTESEKPLAPVIQLRPEAPPERVAAGAGGR